MKRSGKANGVKCSLSIKTMYKFFLLMFFVLIQTKLISYEEKHPLDSNINDFYVLTIPKTGSFLIQKLLVMLTNKNYTNPAFSLPQINPFRFFEDDPSFNATVEEIEFFFLTSKLANKFSMAHFNFADLCRRFSLKHPEYVKIVQIRDLRDACVSCAYHMTREIITEAGPLTFDEILMYIITLQDRSTKENILNIYKNAIKAIEWLNDKTVVVSRFEDLIGVKGGGSLEAQENLIIKIANHLNITLSEDDLYRITQELFGITNQIHTPTFREGRIGSWRKHFKIEHIEAFNRHLGVLQVSLGYSID